MTTATTQNTTPAKGADATMSPAMKRATRRKAKVAGRKKRALKLQSDKEFAKTFFAAKSKRSTDKKSAFRKKKSKKK